MGRTIIREIPWILLVFASGSLLHFTYAWSGYSRLVGIFSAVNESVWEHCKMAFWPALVVAVIRYPRLRRHSPGFWPATAVGLLLLPVTIAGGFHLYTWVLGHHLLVLDILLFLVAIAAGQVVAAWLRSRPEAGARGRRAGVIGVLLLTLAFATCTFHPPHLDLFLDHGASLYGFPPD